MKPDTLQLFLYLLLKATHKDTRYMGYEIKRGQCVFGIRKAALDTKVSPRSIRTSITRLKTTHEVTLQTTHLFSIVTVCNYEIYQSQENENDTPNDTQNDIVTTHDRHTTDTIQECKNEKNKDIVEIVSFLNTTCGTSFRDQSAATRKHISARLSEKFSIQDIKAVITHKHSEWRADPKMKKYLRPETLFGTKFEGYLQEAKTTAKPAAIISESAKRQFEKNANFSSLYTPTAGEQNVG